MTTAPDCRKMHTMPEPDRDPETTPTTVFVVTRGSYSDYRIDSVWTTRALAEAAAAIHPDPWSGEGDIEEWVLNDGAQPPLLQWKATIRFNGETEAITVDDAPEEVRMIEQTSVDYWNGAWEGTGYGRTPEHARKSLADAWAEARARRARL